MKEVLSWLVLWACRAGTRDFYPALAALVSPLQNVFFSSPYSISIYVSTSPSNLDSSRAGPPVTECRSLSLTGEQMNSLSISSKIAYVANVLK